MNRLFRSNSSASSRSSSASSGLATIPTEDINEINYEEHAIQDLNTPLNNWPISKIIPKVPTKQIYKTSFVSSTFNTDLQVTTKEQTYAISKHYEKCSLFNKEMIRQHKLRGHNFVHIGLVQVGIQPLTREGLDSSVLLQLRDARHKNMTNSILGIVESSLANGPIHFDCYHNLKISLHDPHILKILTLGIQTSGAINDMLEGSHTLALIYRIYYKCSKTNSS